MAIRLHEDPRWPAASDIATRPATRHTRRRRPFSLFGTLTLLPALAVAVPVLVVASSLLAPRGDVWAHLASTVLLDYVVNTVVLACGVGAGVLAIGVGAAWLVTFCEFRGRSTLEWALLLPLAVPAYIIGYAYTDLLQFSGPVQSALREIAGWTRDDYWLPDIRSLPGAIAVMSLVFYPYVYLLTRAAFLEQSVSALDASRTLGRGPWRCLLEVAIPLARPAIAAGVALALMETLADFGTVQYFGVATFTTGIYRTWFGLGAPDAAAQLAAALLGVVMLVLLLERALRGPARYAHTVPPRPLTRLPLSAGQAALAQLACVLPVALGFVVPVLVLLDMALATGDDLLEARFLELAANSFTLAGLAALITTALALLAAYGLRLQPTAPRRVATRIAALGYAVPGAVIAVGVLIPFGRLDQTIDAWTQASFGFPTGLLLTGTVAGLLFAYLVRFFAVAFNSAEAGLAKVHRSLDDAARTLGHGAGPTLWRVHVPLLRGSVLTGLVMVFVDVLKELPATLILRPFDFETLAVRVYRFAADERLAEASTAALAIVAVGLLPVVLLSRMITRARPDPLRPRGPSSPPA